MSQGPIFGAKIINHSTKNKHGHVVAKGQMYRSSDPKRPGRIRVVMGFQTMIDSYYTKVTKAIMAVHPDSPKAGHHQWPETFVNVDDMGTGKPWVRWVQL